MFKMINKLSISKQMTLMRGLLQYDEDLDDDLHSRTHNPFQKLNNFSFFQFVF